MAMATALRKLSSNALRCQPLFRFTPLYSMWTKQLNAPLEEVDPEIADIIELEKARQWKGLELIPSENFTLRIAWSIATAEQIIIALLRRLGILNVNNFFGCLKDQNIMHGIKVDKQKGFVTIAWIQQ